MGISEIVLVGYGHSSLKTLLTMSHWSEKKFISDKVFRFYRMWQCQMLCVLCFVTKIQAAILISFWHSLEDQDHIRKITKCKGVKRQWSLFLLRKSRSKANSDNSSLQECCTKSSQSLAQSSKKACAGRMSSWTASQTRCLKTAISKPSNERQQHRHSRVQYLQRLHCHHSEATPNPTLDHKTWQDYMDSAESAHL